jgi:antitoxin component HigA of HigAB toxin-antitoxin module
MNTPNSDNTINTAEEFANAMEEVERLIDIDPEIGTDEGNRLLLLADMIAEYERKISQ